MKYCRQHILRTVWRKKLFFGFEWAASKIRRIRDILRNIFGTQYPDYIEKPRLVFRRPHPKCYSYALFCKNWT